MKMTRYDDDDELWSHYTHLKSADDMSNSDNVIDFIVILVNATQEPVQQMTKIQGK